MIRPEEIPEFTGDLEQLEKDYAALKKDAGQVRSTGADVHAQFQGLSAYYRAPEAEQLFASTKPVADRADAFGSDLETVASALSGYAAEIRPLVEKLRQLKHDAQAFVDSVGGDDDWQYDEDKVRKNNQLRDDVTAAVAAFWAAERTCHNKITALWHGTQMIAGDGSGKKNMYGYSAADLEGAKGLPWGDPVEQKHHWYDVGHWVKSFVWDGLVVDGIWGTVKGLGTLVGVDGWDAMKTAWKGLAQLATGLAFMSNPVLAAAFWATPDRYMPSWLRESRNTMKQTGKALLAWDEWGKNPARAAGAVTFNVVTAVFTDGAGAAAEGAGKAGAVAKAISFAGKAGKVIDPMTYVMKGAGAGLSKIGDIGKALKGAGKIDIPKLPDDAITLPRGTVHLPDGTVRLPEGASLPKGAVHLPDGNVRLPHDAPLHPAGTDPLHTPEGTPPLFADEHGNIVDHKGDVLMHHDGGPPDITHRPTTGSDLPHTPSPARQPALTGAGTHGAEQAGEHIKLGDSTGHDLGDRVPASPAVHAGGDSIPAVHASDDLPGGRVGDAHGSSAGEHSPDGSGRHVPSGTAHDHGSEISAHHQSVSGHADHGDAGGHEHGQHEGHGGHHDGVVSPSHEHHVTDVGHHGEVGGGGSSDSGFPGAHSSEVHPQGTPLEPQPDWHGQSADNMRHYRRPALDLSHLPRNEQLVVLKEESAALADDARNAPGGAAEPGTNHLDSGCAGSLLHDNVVTAHSSTTKMHGQKLPHTHKVLAGILEKIQSDAVASGRKAGLGHGKCAEISLISDRLHQLDPTGENIQTVSEARKLLEGGVMHTRQIGDLVDRKTGELVRQHGEFLAPCETCKHVLPQLGIHVAH
ncbi:YwqJ-related putative deaminase [Streptomyces sp. AM6-12]|uniref:YwqJ-related putative deaminase n=1 Tax=Streptomyces sp. AM6-12 TaxID=3345149 RepID=UPI0037A11D79